MPRWTFQPRVFIAKRLECVELAPAFARRGKPFHLESAGKPDALQALRDEGSRSTCLAGVLQNLRINGAVHGHLEVPKYEWRMTILSRRLCQTSQQRD